jgi:glycosyltransferase involved in cell wall biosynthesis
MVVAAARETSLDPRAAAVGENLRVDEALRIALTLEQCWHRVPGGTAVAGIEIARALAALDEVDPIGVAARHARPPLAGWAPPIEVKQLPLPRLALYEAWHRLRWPAVERATGSVDVIHATTLAIPPRSAPLVVTIHDLAFMSEPAHFTHRGLSFFRRGLDLAKAEADLVLCPSDATLRHCVSEGFERARLRMVPMGVNATEATDEDIAEARDRYGLGRPYIMWSGTVEPRKNLPRLLTAFASLGHDHDLVLVGPTGWNEDLAPLVEPLGDRVRILGFVPHRDLDPLYAGAELFCFPSLAEGFGLPVLEAMAQGTPVVTSKGTSTEEIAGDAGVLVDACDADSIAQGMNNLLTDEDLMAKLKAAGKERAAAYPWSRTARLTADCYREVTA